MSNFKNVEVIQNPQKEKVSLLTKGLFLAASVLAVGSASAASTVDTLYTTMATDVSGISTGTLSVVTVLASVVVLLVGWGYFKKVK